MRREHAVFYRNFRMKTIYALVLAFIVIGAPGTLNAEEYKEYQQSHSPQPEYVPGSLVVHLRNNDSVKTFNTLQQFGATAVSEVGDDTKTEVVQLPSNDTIIVNAALEYLKNQPGVEYVERNQIRRITLAPDDEFFADQWHLSTADAGGVSAEAAWETQTGSDDVVVAVVDTGVDTDHVDLVDNMWVNEDEIPNNDTDDDGNGFVDDYNGYDFVEENGDPTPDPDGLNNDAYAGVDTGVTHGTHVAGIIAAQGNNAIGMSGVAWDTSIMAVRVLDDEGSGTDSQIAAGIEYAVDNGADIIHMSLGGYGSTNTLEAAVQYAIDNNVLIVTAAGNDGVNIDLNPFYPACYAHVLGVGSTGPTSVASSFSNYGDDCVDISAPGETIYSTLYTDDVAYDFTDDYGAMTGTSMAAPVVSGVSALLLAQDATLTPTQLTDIVRLTADDIRLDAAYGAGRVNTYAALDGIELANNPTAPVVSAYSNEDGDKEFTTGTRHAVGRPYFTWTIPEDGDGIAGYYVYFGKNQDANPAVEGVYQTAATFMPEEKITGNETSYYLRVVAVDTLENVSNSAGEFEYVIDTEVQRPQKFRLARAANGIRIRWKVLRGEHIKKYKVYRAENKKKKFQLIASVKHPKRQYIDAKVYPEKTYRYVVKAIDDFGNTHRSKAKIKKFIPKETVVVATGNGISLIRAYSAEQKQFGQSWQAYSAEDADGAEVALGDVDGDGRDEIITVPNRGIPLVKIFEANGTPVSSFMALDPSVRTGARIAVGNFLGTTQEEIAVLSGPGMPPTLTIFAANGTVLGKYNSVVKAFPHSGYLAAVDSDGDGLDELAISVGENPVGHLIVYSPLHSSVVATVNTYPAGVQGDVRLSAMTRASSTKEDVMTVPVNGAVQVRRFHFQQNRTLEAQSNFYGFVQLYTGGGTIAAGRLNTPAVDHIFVGSNGNRQATVQIFSPNGKTLEDTLFPFGGYTGSIHIASGWF